jgi:hypothetical protein
LATNGELWDLFVEREPEGLELFTAWKERIDKQCFEPPATDWETVDAKVDGVDIRFKHNHRTNEYKDFEFV